ncbi:hypothetical protein BDQ17DRAFT_1374257, partial [Cyathus striatus]
HHGQITSSIAIGFLLFPLITSGLPNPVSLYGRKFLLELREIHDNLDERSWASIKKNKFVNGPVGQKAIHLIKQATGIKGREFLKEVKEGVEHFGHSIKHIGQAATQAALKIMKSGVHRREMEDVLYGRDFEINELD